MSSKVWKRTILGTTFVFISIIYTIFLAIHGGVNWNLIFGIQRINSLGNILSAPTNFNYWGHTGNQVNLFVPWVTSIILFPIFQIGNTTISYLMAFGIITFFTLISAFYFINKLSDDTLQAFIFTVIYTLSITRLNIVMDNKISDYLLMVFLPILFYGLFRIFEGFSSDWPFYALGITLVGLTNPWMALSTICVSIIMVAFLILFRETHSLNYWKNLLISMFKSLIMVFILTLSYTVPLLEHGILQSGISRSFIQLKKFNFSNYYKGSQNIYLIIAAIAVVLCIMTLFNSRSYLIYRVSSIGMIFSVVLSSDVINWKSFSSFDFTKATFYFWLVFSFLFCLMISYLLAYLVENKSALFKLIILIFTIILSCTIFYMNLPKQNGDLFDNKISSKESMAVDYSKKNLNNISDLKDFLVNKKLERIQYTTTPNFFEFKYYSPDPVIIDTPVMAYKNVLVQINNENIKSNVSKRGTIEIKTKPGANIVQIKYQYTVISRVAMFISFIGWILIFVLIIHKGKWYIGKLVNNG